MRLLIAVCAAAVLFTDARAERSAPQTEPAVTAVRRCSGCGWIESKREIVPQAARLGAPRNLRVHVAHVRRLGSRTGAERECSIANRNNSAR